MHTFLKSCFLVFSVLLVPAFIQSEQATVFDKIQGACSVSALFEEAFHGFALDPYLDSVYPDASQNITNFIHTMLKEHNVADYETVKIKVGDQYASGNNVIIIEEYIPGSSVSMLEVLSEIMEDPDSEPEQVEDAQILMAQHIGTIEHEISHVKNKDVRKRSMITIALSATTYIALKYAEYTVPEYFPKLKAVCATAKWPLKTAYALLSGGALYLWTKQIGHYFSRYHERKADENISDNPGILYAKMNQHQQNHEFLRVKVFQKFGQRGLTLFDRFPSLYLLFDFEHPTSLERTERFAQRLAKATENILLGIQQAQIPAAA